MHPSDIDIPVQRVDCACHGAEATCADCSGRGHYFVADEAEILDAEQLLKSALRNMVSCYRPADDRPWNLDDMDRFCDEAEAVLALVDA